MTTPILSREENVINIRNHLVKRMDDYDFLNQESIAALLGNIGWESGWTYDYRKKQDNGDAIGLFQFERMKWKDYNEWIDKRKLKDGYEAQVDYVLDELATGRHMGGEHARRVRKVFTANYDSPEEAISSMNDSFIKEFERSGKPKNEERLKAALELYRDYIEGVAPENIGGFINVEKPKINMSQNEPNVNLAADTPFGYMQAQLGRNNKFSVKRGNTELYTSPDADGLNIDINKDLSFLLENRRPKNMREFEMLDKENNPPPKEPYIGFQFKKNFQEGGNVIDPDTPVGIDPLPPIVDTNPDVTSEVLPNTTIQPEPYVSPRLSNPINTDKGFYSVNPAPNESIEDFENRTRVYTQPVDIPKVKASSFKPPEGYVSPRISTSFEDLFGDSSWGESSTGTTTTTGTYTAFPPTDSGLSRDELAALGLLGTVSDVMAGDEAMEVSYWNQEYTSLINRGVTKDVAISFLQHSDFYDMPTLDGNLDKYWGGVADLKETFSTQGVPTTEIGAFVPGENGTMTWVAGKKVGDIVGYKANTISRKAGIDSEGNPIFFEEKVPIYAEEMVTDSNITYDLTEEQAKEIMSNPEKYGVEYDKEGNLVVGKKLQKSINNMQTENFWEKLGNTHLFEVGDTGYNVQLKNLYDEMGATLLVGLATEDWGKAALAGGMQFVKSDVLSAYAHRAGNIAAETVGGIQADGTFNAKGQLAYDKASQNWSAWGGATLAGAGALALGGTAEDALMAAAQHAAIEFGADRVGQMFGLEGKSATQIGGATIAAAIAFLRTGDIKQAAMSGATSYAFSAHPLLGVGMLALQFLMGKKPSNKTGYATFDFDDFESHSYSIGHYKSSKMNHDNMEFTKELLSPLIPYVQELEKEYGIDLKGDIQIHYGSRDGLFYTIGSRDIKGTPREMFLERLDYWDGRDQNVYRKSFSADEQGLQKFYESLKNDLKYIAENKITDLTNYRGIQTSNTNMPINTMYSVGVKQGGFVDNMSNGGYLQEKGGKISLDKGEDVQYNKGNYGFVDKKDKAPPSARADDVSMTLKEGDYVLSQPAVALYGKDTIDRMLSRAATDAGTNLKSGGKVPVNVHNGEYIIPKKLTKYIGSNVLETMNNRGLMSVGERPNI
jgi:hypothetical protein